MAKNFSGRSAAQSISIDFSKNIYSAGYLSLGNSGDSIDFDPDLSNYIKYKSSDQGDIYFCKTDSLGKIKWANFLIDKNGNSAYPTIANDKLGNVYLAGRFSDSVDMDPDPIKHYYLYHDKTPTNHSNIFLAKYDTDGKFLWAFLIPSKQMNYDEVDLEIDNSNNIYLTSCFRYTNADFDPDSAITYPLTANYSKAFIAKYTSEAKLLWVVVPDNDLGTSWGGSMHINKNNDVYLIGSSEQGVDFDPSNNTHSTNGGGCYVASYDSLGNFKSLFNLYGISAGSDVVTDDSNNIYITGQFYKNVDFDPDPNTTFELTYDPSNPSGYVSMAFIGKYSKDGKLKWVYKYGTGIGGMVWGRKIDIKKNEIYLCGSTSESIDADPNSNVEYPLLLTTYSSGFICKYTLDGKLISAFLGANTPGKTTYAHYIEDFILYNQSIYVCGYLENTIDLDPRPSHSYLLTSSYSPYSSFIAQYKPCDNSTAPVFSTIPYNKLCKYNNVHLAIKGGNLVDADYWVWRKDSCNGKILGIGDSLLFSSSVSTTIFASGGGQCVNTAPCNSMQFNVSADSLPVVKAYSTKNSLCPGDTLTFDATGALTYYWNDSLIKNKIPYAPKFTGDYIVTGVDSAGCFNTDTIFVFVKPKPSVTFNYPQDSICSNVSFLNLTSYGTPVGGVFSGNGIQTNVLYPSNAGEGKHEISYEYTNGFGCSTTDIDTIIVVDCGAISINEISKKNIFITIEAKYLSINNITNNSFQAFIYNSEGKIVYSNKNEASIPLENISKGLYYLQVLTDDKVFSFKFLIN